MRKLICPTLFISAIALMFVACSAKRGCQHTETKDFDGLKFKAIEARHAVEVIYKPTKGPARVRLEACPDIIDRYEARVSDGTLICMLRDGKSVNNPGPVTFYVYAPAVSRLNAVQASKISVSSLDFDGWLNLETSSAGGISISSASADGLDISASSAGDISIGDGTFTTVTIDASSAADIDIDNLQADLVTVDASSAADVTLSGRATRVKLSASSSADIKATGLKARSGSAKASSCASVKCNVDDLSTTSSSNGSVTNRQR